MLFNEKYDNIVKNILKRFIRIEGEILKNKLIKIELSRAIKSKTMALVLFLGLVITVSQIFTYVIPIANFNERVVVDNYPMASPTTVFQAWIGNINILPQSYIFFALLPLLAAIPFADTFFTDRKSGYIKNVLVRTKKKDYFLAKYIATFISGGLAITIPLLVNLIIAAMFLPSFVPEVTQSFAIGPAHLWSKLFFTHPYIYLIGFLMIDFIFSGLIATIGLSVSFFIEYRFMALITPFIVYIFVYTVLGSFNLAKYIPFYFLQPGFEVCNGYVVLGEIIGLSIITFGMFFFKGVKDDIY